MRNLWDPHAGLKPSERDDLASDASIKVEDDLPPGGDEEVSAAMVNMMVDVTTATRHQLGRLVKRDGKRDVPAQGTGPA
jgi:hypothetical protein